MKKNLKPTLAAIAFFAAMSIISVGAAHAQINLLEPVHRVDTNSLLATTGPNTVGDGHLQLSATLDGMYNSFIPSENMVSTPPDFGNVYTDLDGDLGLRYGIGNRFEVSAGFGANRYRYTTFADRQRHTDSTWAATSFYATLGAKMLLMEGSRGWLPQMAIAGSIGIGRNNNWNHTPYTSAIYGLGLQLRNRLGSRWTIDYSLGVKASHAQSSTNAVLDYSLMARWLATDRLLLGAGFENGNGRLEVLYQATPTLQLGASAGYSLGYANTAELNRFDASLGVSWMLR